MVFINPKTDFAFKKIFGSKKSKDILINFLNALLYQEQDTIKDLEILDPYQAPKIQGIKDSYLDVKAVIADNKTVIIEMQVLNVLGFEKRVLYNAAKAFSIQLGVGEYYTLLNPVIALTITDFEMFSETNKVISRYRLKEKDELTDYSDDIELVFVELPKFTKDLEQLETITDKGREEGMEEGKQQKAMEIARGLLDVLDIETISQKTGLSVAEIQKLV